ncbi:FHA domain-containing protein FhaB/FipA [Actinocatenispora rupis]|uniref:Phosphopeptide-binding protein n=1 Tax=Actinocatenispora rupis TaxID=519421 RepID=A0A8J3J257_9ACTN|nr:FHA domain-containing protein [Actinocatenispora rupis]GID13170.1 phosphopeptide-binding protein [Actinocatenispora rupis]
MPSIVLAVARFGFLALLWIFVFAVAGVVRRDLWTGSRSNRLVAAPRGVPAAGPPQPAPARPRRGQSPRILVVTEGALAGTTITLTDRPITMGRAEDSTVVLTDDYASTRHARLVARNGEWFLEDVGSTNGTYLDRAKVTGPTPVPLGVPIRIGRTALELRP